MKMDYESIAKKILQRVGGKENVISLVHCMTRLRFTLKDESIVDDEAVKKTKGVMGIMKKPVSIRLSLVMMWQMSMQSLISLEIFQTKYRKKHRRIRKNRMYFLC